MNNSDLEHISKPLEYYRLTIELLTLDEAASFFKVHKRTISQWIKAGKLEAYRPSGPTGHRRISRESIDRLLEATRIKKGK